MSALVAEYLASLVREDAEFRRLEALQEDALGRVHAAGGIRTSDRPRRPELYDDALDDRGLHALR